MLQSELPRKGTRRPLLAVFLAAFGTFFVALPASARPVIDHDVPRPVARDPLTFQARVTSPGTVLAAFLCYRVLHGAMQAVDSDLALQLATGTEPADGGAAPAAPEPQKSAPAPDFRMIPMQSSEADTYQAVVPAAELDADSLEYFIVAYDAADLSEGYWHSRESPERIFLPLLHPVERPDAGDDDWNPTSEKPVAEQDKPHKRPNKLDEGSYDGTIDPPYQMPPGAGYLRIVSDPSGATIKIDGVGVGYAPMEKAIVVGTHLITGVKHGYQLEKRVVGVANGHGRQVALHLIEVGKKRSRF